MTRALFRRVAELEASGRIPPLRPRPDPVLMAMTDEAVEALQEAAAAAADTRADPATRAAAEALATALYAAAAERSTQPERNDR